MKSRFKDNEGEAYVCVTWQNMSNIKTIRQKKNDISYDTF